MFAHHITLYTIEMKIYTLNCFLFSSVNMAFFDADTMKWVVGSLLTHPHIHFPTLSPACVALSRTHIVLTLCVVCHVLCCLVLLCLLACLVLSCLCLVVSVSCLLCVLSSLCRVFILSVSCLVLSCLFMSCFFVLCLSRLQYVLPSKSLSVCVSFILSCVVLSCLLVSQPRTLVFLR
jgi:hypothetical protein